jgi:tetratricopeptide (TPR) repeat protein
VVKALLGRKEEAIADLREAVRLEPGLLEAYVSLGSLLAGSGRREEAREAYRLGLRRCGASAADKGMRRVLEAELARL